MNKLTLQIAADHPVGAGHFPGNPIIPGALLLAEVLRAISNDLGESYKSCNIKSAKFQHPVRPGDKVEIMYAYSERGEIDFQCTVAGTSVMSGVVSAAIDA